MKVRVISCNKFNWYKTGEIYEVRDSERYSGIGVQVWVHNDNEIYPDVIKNGDFEYIE